MVPSYLNILDSLFVPASVHDYNTWNKKSTNTLFKTNISQKMIVEMQLIQAYSYHLFKQTPIINGEQLVRNAYLFYHIF